MSDELKTQPAPDPALAAAIMIHKKNIPPPFNQGMPVDLTDINENADIIRKHFPASPAPDETPEAIEKLNKLQAKVTQMQKDYLAP